MWKNNFCGSVKGKYNNWLKLNSKGGKNMNKIRRFVVLQVTFRTSEMSLPLIFRDLKHLGIEVIKIQWKNENCLKLRAGIDQPEISRKCAVSAIVNKAQSYFRNAVVVATYGKSSF